MKMQTLKTEVYFMSECQDTKCLKAKFPQFSGHNFRLTETWQEIYDFLSNQEAKQIDAEQPVIIDEIIPPGALEIDPQEIEVPQASHTEKGQIDLPKRNKELTPHLVLGFLPAAQRIAKGGTGRKGMQISRRVRKDKSRGFDN